MTPAIDTFTGRTGPAGMFAGAAGGGDEGGAPPTIFYRLMKAPGDITNDELGELIVAEMLGPVSTPAAGGYSESDFTPVASIPPQSIGVVPWIAATLEPGTYAAICWFPTAGTGEPRAMKGVDTVFRSPVDLRVPATGRRGAASDFGAGSPCDWRTRHRPHFRLGTNSITLTRQGKTS